MCEQAQANKVQLDELDFSKERVQHQAVEILSLEERLNRSENEASAAQKQMAQLQNTLSDMQATNSSQSTT